VIVLVPAPTLNTLGYIGLAQLLMDIDFTSAFERLPRLMNRLRTERRIAAVLRATLPLRLTVLRCARPLYEWPMIHSEVTGNIPERRFGLVY
jgi:hypothetical protein